MCGRFALSTEVNGLPAPLRDRMDGEHRRHYAPRDLIRPGQPLLALRRDEGNTEASLMLWGLIPSWSKDPSTGPRPFNARAETVAEKASFRGAWRHRRCLIPATSFFEGGIGSPGTTVSPSGSPASGSAGSGPMAVRWTPAQCSPPRPMP